MPREKTPSPSRSHPYGRPGGSPPPGYKRTDVGVIPVDWEVKSLGDLCTGIYDGTHQTPNYTIYGVPFYSVENVTANDFNNAKFISESEHKKLSKRCKLEKGDILLTRIGSLGETKLIDWDVDASFYVSLALLKLKPESDALYLYCYTKSRQFIVNVEQRSLLNASPKKINLGNISSIPIPLPPLAEQRAIAGVLSDVDAWLAALDRLIAKKRAVKQAAMQDLLTGRVRLPGFSGEWTVRKLGEILTLQYGQSQKGIAEMGGSYPILATSGIVGKTNQYLYDKPSIIIGRKGTIDTPYYVDVPFWPIDTTFYTVIADSVLPKFLYYLLTTINWQAYNEASGVPSLNANTVHNIEIYLPLNIDEQRAIAGMLSDMDAEIAALERQRVKGQALKQGLMQELLTGRIRVVKPKSSIF